MNLQTRLNKLNSLLKEEDTDQRLRFLTERKQILEKLISDLPPYEVIKWSKAEIAFCENRTPHPWKELHPYFKELSDIDLEINELREVYILNELSKEQIDSIIGHYKERLQRRKNELENKNQ